MSKDRIEFLLDKYSVKVPGEVDVSCFDDAMGKWRMSQKLRVLDNISSRLHMGKSQRAMARDIVELVDNLNSLGAIYSQETIITAICIYSRCAHNKKFRVSTINVNRVCKENKLTMTAYTTIITRLAIFLAEKYNYRRNKREYLPE